MVACLAGLVACGDKDRRLTPREAYQYKLSAVERNQDQLAEIQKKWLMHHPGRTQREIDDALDKFRREYSDRQARERAEWTGDRAGARRSDLGRAGVDDRSYDANDEALFGDDDASTRPGGVDDGGGGFTDDVFGDGARSRRAGTGGGDATGGGDDTPEGDEDDS